MGKNQTHKAMQQSKHRGGGGGGADTEQDARYNGVDASFHTSEWHAARLAALTMERPRCACRRGAVGAQEHRQRRWSACRRLARCCRRQGAAKLWQRTRRRRPSARPPHLPTPQLG